MVWTLRRISAVTSLPAVAILAALPFGTAGCAKSHSATQSGRMVRVDDGSTGGLPQTGDANPSSPTQQLAIDASEPCDARLQDISGMLLSFWSINKRLPTRLEDLRPLSDSLTPPNFDCPVTNQPYVYLPQASGVIGLDRRLVVYTPAKSPVRIPGKNETLMRYRAILMRLPQGGQTPGAWVVTLDDRELKEHLARVPSGGAAPMRPSPTTSPSTP